MKISDRAKLALYFVLFIVVYKSIQIIVEHAETIDALFIK